MNSSFELIVKTRCSAVILSGGEGARFGGADKGLLSLDGISLVEIILKQIQPEVAEVMISANRNLDYYKQLGAQLITDSTLEFHGPLAGVVRALECCQTEFLITIAVDMISIPAQIINTMVRKVFNNNDLDIIVAEDQESVVPTFAIYRRSVLPAMKESIVRNEFGLQRFQQSQKTLTIKFEDWRVTNVNTPDDYAKLIANRLMNNSASKN